MNSYVTAAAYDGLAALGGDVYMDGISYTRDNAAAPWTTTDKGIYYWPSISSGKKVQFLHTRQRILRLTLFHLLAILQFLLLLMILLQLKRFSCCTRD